MINLTNKTNNVELAKEITRLFDIVRKSLRYCTTYENIEEMLNSGELSLFPYKDQDGYDHVLFKTNQYTDEEMIDYMDGIYNTIYETGEMCLTMGLMRSKKFRKRLYMFQETEMQVTVNKTIKISILTVASILMFSRCRLREEYDKFSIMSILTYWLDSTEI